MTLSDFERFRDGIAGVMSFYGKEISHFALDVWWNALKGFDLDAVVDAFNRHVCNPDSGQFAPKPADIIRLLQGSTQDSALRAWAKVDKAVRQVGPYRTVAFDDPIIHAVIHDMGGWISLGSREEKDWPFVAREFETRYRAIRTQGGATAYPPSLPGVSDAHNLRLGKPSEPIVLIGDHKAAQAVISQGTQPQPIGLRQAATLLPLPRRDEHAA